MAEPPYVPTESDVVARVRACVRAERAYHVGGTIDPPVKLNQNESPFDLPGELRDDVFERLRTIAFNRYPTEQPDSLCAAIGERIGHPAEGILVGNGSNELTHTLGLGFVEAGVQVVLPRPMFALYTSMVNVHGGMVVPVAPRRELSFDVDGIVRAIRTSRAAMAVVCSPNNPTGLALDPDEIVRIVTCSDAIVVVDEAYVEFNPHGSVLGMIERHPNLIVLRTLSKAFGLAGLRVGYLAARPALTAELLKARLPFMIDRFSQAVAHAVLERPDLVRARVDHMIESTARITRELLDIPGVEVIPSSTNFVLFRGPFRADELLRDLAGQGVLVRNMSGYPELAGYLRVSAGLDDENRAFLTALKRALFR